LVHFDQLPGQLQEHSVVVDLLSELLKLRPNPERPCLATTSPGRAPQVTRMPCMTRLCARAVLLATLARANPNIPAAELPQLRKPSQQLLPPQLQLLHPVSHRPRPPSARILLLLESGCYTA